MGSRAFFPEIKLKWIKYFRSLQITIEAMKHVTLILKYVAKVRKDRTWPITRVKS